MGPALLLPRLLFGAGAIASLDDELKLMGADRVLLLSDRGLENAGVVQRVLSSTTRICAQFLDIPENPTAAGADEAFAAFRAADCDVIVALGGGSVIDTGKVVAALVTADVASAAELIGQAANLLGTVAPLVAIPTTIGTGSESSPVSALHLVSGGPAFGMRGPQLVPKLAICDPDLARTLPLHLIAATGIDALSHCIEGFFAEPENPVIDALALDGAARVFADIHGALEVGGDAARASLMAAAFAGGGAIHKGLGPAHAVALACGDQHVHHGTLVGVALPHTTRLLAAALPAKAFRLRRAMGLRQDQDIGEALEGLLLSLQLPCTLSAASYKLYDETQLVDAMVASHFNRSSPYVPSRREYAEILDQIK